MLSKPDILICSGLRTKSRDVVVRSHAEKLFFDDKNVLNILFLKEEDSVRIRSVMRIRPTLSVRCGVGIAALRALNG